MSEFMRLAQLKDGYRYNSDTMALYDFITRFVKPKKGLNLLDVGCGCGILGLLLKRDIAGVKASLLDILDINFEISAHNARINALEAAVIRADFKNFKSESKFDLIVSNPPFYRDGVSESKNEHIATGRYARYLNLRDFLRSANANLGPKGELFFCYEAAGIGEVLVLLGEFKFRLLALRFVYPKADSNANLALFYAKKSSRSMCEILPPLVMSENGAHSKEASEIFTRANTRSEDYESEILKDSRLSEQNFKNFSLNKGVKC